MGTLVNLGYLLRHCFPGDFECYLPDDHDYPVKFCSACKCKHLANTPLDHWMDEHMALAKREDNADNKLVSRIRKTGMIKPIALDIERHRVVTNGHHRVYAAIDLGWEWIPAELIVDGNKYHYNIPAVRWMRPYDGSPYTESSRALVMA